jgi:hypothetical protein
MVIDLTATKEYRVQMEEAIEANREWFDGLGYADADFDLKAWMLWHRMRDGLATGDEGARMPCNASNFNCNQLYGVRWGKMP